MSVDGEGKPYTHEIPPIDDAVGVEIVELSAFPGKKMEDFPSVDEYFGGMYAYDDEETEAMCDCLKSKMEKEKQNEEEQK